MSVTTINELPTGILPLTGNEAVPVSQNGVVVQIPASGFAFGSGVGTLSSISLSASSGIFTVSGSPVTGVGTFVLGLAPQASGLALGSPSGASGIPSFIPISSLATPFKLYAENPPTVVTSPQALSPNSFALGNGAITSGASGAIAIGPGATANFAGIAIGSGAVVFGPGSGQIAIGAGAIASGSGNNFVSFGHGSLAIGAGDNVVSIGGGTASGAGATQINTGNGAFGINAIAIGNSAIASGASSLAIGNSASASASGIAIGTGTTSTAVGAIAYGNSCHATAANAIAIGNTSCGGQNSIALGVGHNVTAANGAAFGQSAASTSFGEFGYASGEFSTAGDSQIYSFCLRNTSSGSSGIGLFANGVSGGITVPVSGTYAFTALVVVHDPSTLANSSSLVTATPGLVTNISASLTFFNETWGAAVGASGLSGITCSFSVSGTSLLLTATPPSGYAGSLRWVASVKAARLVG